MTLVCSLALTLSVLVSFGGVAMSYSLAGERWALPLAIPVLALLAGVQGWRHAAWRSTVWGLSRDGRMALRISGVVRRKVYATRAERPTERLLEGLTPASGRLLAEAFRCGRVPEHLPESRGSWASVFGVFLYAGLAIAIAWAGTAYEQHTEARARAAATLVDQQLKLTVAEWTPKLVEEFVGRVEAATELSAAQRTVLLERYAARAPSPEVWSSSQSRGRWSHRQRWIWPTEVAGEWDFDFARVDVRVTYDAGLTIEAVGAAPDNPRFVAALVARLEQAGLEPVEAGVPVD